MKISSANGVRPYKYTMLARLPSENDQSGQAISALPLAGVPEEGRW